MLSPPPPTTSLSPTHCKKNVDECHFPSDFEDGSHVFIGRSFTSCAAESLQAKAVSSFGLSSVNSVESQFLITLKVSALVVSSGPDTIPPWAEHAEGSGVPLLHEMKAAICGANTVKKQLVRRPDVYREAVRVGRNKNGYGRE